MSDQGELASLNVIRVMGKLDLELMVNAAFILRDFSTIKRESRELVDDVLAFLREGFAASAGIFKFSHEEKRLVRRPFAQ